MSYKEISAVSWQEFAVHRAAYPLALLNDYTPIRPYDTFQAY